VIPDVALAATSPDSLLRFRALVLGNDPQVITLSGTHDLN